MFIVDNYPLAILFCFITMICWGSWGNTQKLASKNWRYELYYWDYTIGIFLFSLLLVFTLGSTGDAGRGFLDDIGQVDTSNVVSALIGGVIFNASNILLSASVSMAGMAVAFPLGVGLALVLGVFINYFSTPKGDPLWLFAGVALIVAAIVCNGVAAGRQSAADGGKGRRGVLLAALAGLLMAFFYRFVAAAMDLAHFEHPTPGVATPYTAFFLFALGILLSNFVFNTLVMRRPFTGAPVSYKAYFAGRLSTHLTGLLGGCIWGLGTALSYIAAGRAGAAVSYALGQGAPMIAALWGVFVWREFKGGDAATSRLLWLMFLLFAAGLSCIIISGGN